MGMAAAIAVGYLANIPPKELAENVHDWLALAFSVLGGSP
jgi:hypothetical protein